jgi:HNH endonuclease/AP2 domain
MSIALPGYIDREAWEGFEDIVYCERTGHFIRLVKTVHNAEERADRPTANGYRTVRVKSKVIHAHRLAWLYVYGVLPPEEVDHINGDTMDNRIENLRLANRTQNCGNIVKRPGACGLFGVSKQSNTRKYRASITVNSKRLSLGYFDTAEEAHAVAMAALDKHRGEFSPAARIRGVK